MADTSPSTAIQPGRMAGAVAPTPTPTPVSGSGGARVSGVRTGMARTTRSTPAPTPSLPPRSGVGVGGGKDPTSSTFYMIVLGITLVAMIIATTTIIGISGDPNNNELNTTSGKIWMDILSVVFALCAVGAIMLGRRNLRGMWGRMGFVCLSIVLVAMTITLSVICMNTLSSGAATFGSLMGAFILAGTYAMLYYGSSGESTTHTLFYYGSVVLLILYALFFLIVFGNPVGIPTSIREDQYTSISDKYKIIYKSDSTLQGVAKRRLFDQVYLSVAYPTLSTNESAPLHNSSEIKGSHYLSEYGKHLKNGASAFLFDIFYETNGASPNVNTWRIGTLNTDSGVVQNRRTISLQSVLNSTNKAIEASSGTQRLIYLFLNPRYKTSQRDMIPKLEDSLAKLIQDNVSYLTLPSLSVSLSENSRMEDQYLANASKQVVIFIGGTRNASSLSTKLKNTVHGVVNLTDCFVRTEGAQGYNAIAYDSQANANRKRLDLGTGSFACTNESRIEEFVRNDSRQSVQSSFVMTLPDTTSQRKNKDGTYGYIAYMNEIPPYISHSVSFPFVYPTMINDFTNNESFFYGYAPVMAPKTVISMIMSNEDGENKPARQRMNANLRCNEEYNNAKVLNPAQDSEWDSLFGSQKANSQLAKGNWCNNFKGNQDNRSQTNIDNPSIHPFVLYEPDGKYSGGMIPKPTLVQTTNGEIYQLRKVVQTQTVIPASTESS